jgi:hypothetical protein
MIRALIVLVALPLASTASARRYSIGASSWIGASS